MLHIPKEFVEYQILHFLKLDEVLPLLGSPTVCLENFDIAVGNGILK
jgi:hypothetical protein